MMTLGHFEGLSSDTDAPRWTTMDVNRPLQFRQPRGAMCEVLMKVIFWSENTNIVRSISQ